MLSSQGLECKRRSTVPKEETHDTTLVNCLPLVTISFTRESLMLTEEPIANLGKCPNFNYLPPVMYLFYNKMNKRSLEQGFGLTDPHTYLSLGSHVPPGSHVNQYVTFFSYPTNYIRPQKKGLSLGGSCCFWLLGHWASGHLDSGHPGACHLSPPPLLLLPPCFALQLCLSLLTLASPILFHGNRSLIN